MTKTHYIIQVGELYPKYLTNKFFTGTDYSWTTIPGEAIFFTTREEAISIAEHFNLTDYTIITTG